jgi:putative glutamine amidotransferase
MMLRPVIGIPCCLRMMGAHPAHMVMDKYIRAVAEGAGGTVVLIPALGPDLLDFDALLEGLDGVLLTGSHSNVEPVHYAGEASPEGTLHDPARDATTLPLVRAALDRGIPLLGICRGFQELNVALGGTLHQRVHAVDGLMDHREDKDQPADVQYAPTHPVFFTPNGVLSRLLGGAHEDRVNSLHGQGLKQLAPGLAIEAIAPDGLVEAVRVADAEAYALAVQWHPEWRFRESPLSRALFSSFGAAARLRAAQRLGLLEAV